MSVVYHSLTTNYLIFLSEMIVKSVFFFFFRCLQFWMMITQLVKLKHLL